MMVPIRELGGGARQGIRRATIVLSFTPVNSLSPRSVGLFFARSVPELSIHTALLFDTVPRHYPYAQPRSPPNFELYDSFYTKHRLAGLWMATIFISPTLKWVFWRQFHGRQRLRMQQRTPLLPQPIICDNLTTIWP
jgi:hypothetical protein